MNSGVFANIETIQLSGSANQLTVANQLTATTIIGGSTDTVTLSNGSGNTASLTGIDTLIGGGGSDTITLTTVLVAGSVDLAGGTDTAILANGVNAGSFTNVETIVLSGSAAPNILTLGNAQAAPRSTARAVRTIPWCCRAAATTA